MKYIAFIFIGLHICSSIFAKDIFPAQPMNIVFAAGYPPYSSWDENGNPKGVLIELAKEVFEKKLNLPILPKVYPWKRAQKMVKDGMADAFITVPTDERKTYTHVIEPFFLPTEFKIFISRQNSKKNLILQAKNLKEVKEIQNITSGYLIGSGWHLANLQGFSQIKKVASVFQILKMVESQRIDIYIDNPHIVRFHLKKYNMQDSIIELPVSMDNPTWNICIGKKSGYAKNIHYLSEKLRLLEKDGSMARMRNNVLNSFYIEKPE